MRLTGKSSRPGSSSSSSSSRPGSRHQAAAVVVRAAGRQPRVDIAARSCGAAALKVVYMPNLLPADDADAVLQEALTMRPQLRQELNCIAVGRMGAYVPPESVTTGVFSTKELSRKLQQLLSAPFPLFLSDFPIELRSYPKAASMPWHLDEQMYASPQWELIYTLENTSDSRTEWRDASGRQHSVWTEPNSLVAVEAEGWEHRVTPVKRGGRLILKMAFTSTSIKLPAFDTNLEREAFTS